MTIRRNKGPVTRFLARFPIFEWPRVVRAMSALNVALYRASGGRLMNALEGAPICLVTMRGRKSGQLKTVPLMYVPHGDELLLVASLGGGPKHPAWYHNLIADPQITVQVGRKRQKMRAREAHAEEHARLWPIAVAAYPSYADYQQRTARRIPILVCTATGRG